MRLFVAVFVTETIIREKIMSLQKEVGSLPGKLKLVEPNNLHYTLLFLGEVSETRVEIIKTELKKLKQVSSFDLELKGAGVFPNLKRPRVFWVSAGKGSEKLTELAKQVRSLLSPLGYKDSKSFTPHLTISRIKWLEPMAKQKLNSMIRVYENTSFGIQHINSFSLVESTLTSQGPIYESIEDFPLR